MFVSAKYTRDTKSNDAMYVWLENVNLGGFEVCIREFLPFDGKHQDTIVASVITITLYYLTLHYITLQHVTLRYVMLF